jgi:SRSO17 transposase
MPPRSVDRSRFDRYVERLAAVLGHADRRAPLEAYLTGLLLPGERKSVEPMAARVAPREVSRTHQSMHHFVATAPWDERELLAVARDYSACCSPAPRSLDCRAALRAATKTY